MSYNILTVQGQKPALNGVVNVDSADLGGFASATDTEYFGVDGSGDPKNVDITTSTGLLVVYSMRIIYEGWGGSSAQSINNPIYWRRQSAIEYIDATYCAVGAASSGPKWATNLTLQPGKYVCIATLGAAPSSQAATLGVRMRDETAGAYVGPHFLKGGGHNADSFYSLINVSSASTFSWYMTSMSGTFSLMPAAKHLGSRIVVFKI